MWAALAYGAQKLQWARQGSSSCSSCSPPLRAARRQPNAIPPIGNAVEPDIGAALRARLRALVILRGQAAIVAVWSGLLLIDATGQVNDLFRSWVGPWRYLGIGLAATLLLSTIVWTGSRRVALDNTEPYRSFATSRQSSNAFAMIAVVAAALSAIGAVTFHSLIPLGLGVSVLLVCLLDVVRYFAGAQSVFTARDNAAMQSTTRATNAPIGDDLLAIKAVARMLTTVVLLVVGLAIVRAGTAPFLLFLTAGSDIYGSAAWLLAIGCGVVAASVTALPWVLRKLDAHDDVPYHLEWRHMTPVAIALVLAATMVGSPLDVPPWLGSIAVAAICFSVFVALFAELQRFSERSVPTNGLTMLGLRRVPVFTMLAIWFIAASFMPADKYHEIRTIARSASPPEAAHLWSIWNDWRAANCVDASTGDIPLVIVATEGGGIRAAYWTAQVLDQLDAQPATVDGCPSATPMSRVFAVSGISGGSVGAAGLPCASPVDTRRGDG